MTKKDLTNKDWWAEVAVRSMRTCAETALSMITVGQAVMDVNWVNVASVSLVAGFITVLMSVAFGLNGKER